MHGRLHVALFSLLFLLSSTTWLVAQSSSLAQFTVSAGAYDRLNTPVSASLDGLDVPEDWTHWQLVEHQGEKTTPVAMQWQPGPQGTLSWVLMGKTPAGTSRRFSLQKGSSSSSSASSSTNVTAKDQDGAVTFSVGGNDMLTYQYALAEVPEGVDEIYRRGGFIHPLRSLKGGTLTRIQPSDHYHHYGIWNPWTHTEYEGREIDFWNLVKGQGTVAAKGVTSVTGGAVFGELTSWHEFITYQDSAKKETAQKILDETWNVRVWNNDPQQKVYLVDFVSTQSNVTDKPLTVKEYRYQGFGFRANKDWNDDTAQLLTSEGKNKADGNGTRARWGNVSGPTSAGTSGVVFMTHPSNFNFPELIRIWPEGMNEGKENVFFNFNPTQDRDMVLKPRTPSALKYRMLVYDGDIDTETANRYWQDFAYPPRVTIAYTSVLKGKKMLLYTKNGEGYVHDNIPHSIEAIRKLADENGFEVVASEDPALFTTDNLKQFDALIFSNTNNDIFDTKAQERAFQDYMQTGGRLVAIHAACASERDWPWFWKIVGGTFVRHAARQDFDVKVIDKNNPSTQFLPDTWHIKDDECYYLDNLNPNIHVLLAADLTTVDDPKNAEYPGKAFGSTFPTSWCHATDGGRQWYTSLGHRAEHYEDPMLMKHILGGIQWVLSDDAP